MCGLAGFARFPTNLDSERMTQVREAFHELMRRTETRGRHATGVAVVGEEKAFLWKRALSMSAINAAEWQESVLDGIDTQTMIAIGHTRHATVPNAHVDEAAHPFVHGKTVGAHNGMIHNWESLRLETQDGSSWIVDSQAAISLLDKHADAAVALGKLDGWYALSWVKNRKLFLFRTTDSVLACAYVPSIATLFWQSEMSVLRDTLRKVFGSECAIEVWETKPDTLYRYDPRKFTSKGTGVRKRKINLKAKKKMKYRKGGTMRTFGGNWDWNEARETRDRLNAAAASRPKWTKRGELLDAGGETAELVTRLGGLIGRLTGRVEALEAEVKFLLDVARENGLLDIAGPVDEEGHVEVCAKCHEPAGALEMLETPDGEHVHADCLI